jgi:hypothetical protein
MSKSKGGAINKYKRFFIMIDNSPTTDDLSNKILCQILGRAIQLSII